MIIDPGAEATRILREAAGLKVKAIIATHGHFDHVAAVNEIKDSLRVPFLLHKADLQTLERYTGWFGQTVKKPEVDIFLKDEFRIGGIRLKVIHTPGHTPGSVSILADDEALFSGDTLFRGAIGRYDFPGGSLKDMRNSIRKLIKLPEYIKVYPGHGEPTTIGMEREDNPFVLEFIDELG